VALVRGRPLKKSGCRRCTPRTWPHHKDADPTALAASRLVPLAAYVRESLLAAAEVHRDAKKVEVDEKEVFNPWSQ
jgi:hypothetical protein